MSELDSIVLDNGEEFDSSKEKLVTMKDMKTTKLAYDDVDIMNDSLSFPTSDDVAMSELEAKKHLIYETARLKLQKEQETLDKMSDDEKIKDYMIKSLYYKETNDFYHKYGYEMSGKQKRMTRRSIETAWAKGKIKLTEDQKTDILVELANAARPQRTEKVATDQVSALNNITALTYKG